MEGPMEFVFLLCRETGALAGIGLGLVHPITQRLVRDSEIVCKLGDGLLQGSPQPDGLGPELRRVPSMYS